MAEDYNRKGTEMKAIKDEITACMKSEVVSYDKKIEIK